MILIGTSGFSYQDWVGPFYPAGTSKQDFLKLYARKFPLVELNFSYYRQPDPKTLIRMVENTPPGFLFSIKAHRSLTHDIKDDFPESIRLFKEGIAPLVEADRLAAILFQFPYSFHYIPQSRQHLKEVCSAFSGLPAVVEFRNAEWQKDSVYEGLRSHHIGLVSVDEPELPKLPRADTTVTAEPAYIRFHGRNKKNWWTGDNASRYDYLYSKEELVDWLPLIEKILRQVRLLLITFNNHSRGQAVRNALDLKQLLSERKAEVR